MKPYSQWQKQILTQAANILEQGVKEQALLATDPDLVKAYLQTKFGKHDREVFACLFLNNKHGLIAFEEMFLGTIDGATVHPREVARRALELNAAAVILVHNHPAGDPAPSESDKKITRRLTEALKLLDIRVLDHFVVGNPDIISFAEEGLL